MSTGPMREVANFDDLRLAQRFADVLCSHEIPTNISETRAGGFAVWVIHEADLAFARDAHAAFEAAPDDPAHRAADGCVEKRRRESEQEERRSRHAVISVRDRLRQPGTGPVPVTILVVAVSVAVTVVVQSQARERLLAWVLIGLPGEALFARVLQGEVWRLLTPIFVHFGWLHIFFNGWWVADLGAALERRLGSGRLTGIIVLSGVLSNALQYVVAGNPVFGGLSGVVYALLGYVWARGRKNPTLGFGLSQQTIVILLVWLGLGFSGVLGNVANFAHLGGLIVGVVLGLL